MAATTIRTLDFGDFLQSHNEELKRSTAKDILESFKTIGFVCLKNHGLPQERVDEMFEWSSKFFSLPLESKMLAPHPPSGTHHRGYSAPGVEQVGKSMKSSEGSDSPHLTGDVKESFECGKEDDSLMPNIWLPEETLPGFRSACLDFYWTCYELEKDILRALALAFDLPEDYFMPFHRQADNQLRLLHYPSVPRQDSENLSRIAAHTDYDTITLLFQDDVGGLEVEDPHRPGTFVPIEPVPNTVVVNAGDFLTRWSNDIIKSTLHRVRAPTKIASNETHLPERYSIPYFCSCDITTVVDTIPGTWSVDNPKKYEPISAMDYVMERLAAAY